MLVYPGPKDVPLPPAMLPWIRPSDLVEFLRATYPGPAGTVKIAPNSYFELDVDEPHGFRLLFDELGYCRIVVVEPEIIVYTLHWQDLTDLFD